MKLPWYPGGPFFPGGHNILLTFSNSCDLPDDVFGEGEVKPVRQQKKKLANGTTKKRVASDVCNLTFWAGRRALSSIGCSTLNQSLKGRHGMAVLTFYRIRHRPLLRDIRLDDICAKPPPISCLPSRIDRQLTTGLPSSFFGFDQPNCNKVRPRPTQILRNTNKSSLCPRWQNHNLA